MKTLRDLQVGDVVCVVAASGNSCKALTHVSGNFMGFKYSSFDRDTGQGVHRSEERSIRVATDTDLREQAERDALHAIIEEDKHDAQ